MAAASWWAVAFLVDISLKAALLAVLVWAAMAVFRLRVAPVKHRVWVLVLAGMMLMPVLVHVVPAVSLPQGFEVEEYRVSRTRQEASLSATVVSKSPLVLQLNE